MEGVRRRGVKLLTLLLAAGRGAADGVTSAYRRPRGARMLSDVRIQPHARCARPLAGCSEQVHLALGGPSAMTASWATSDDTTSSAVTYWGPDGIERVAHGRATAYSQILFIDHNLLDPEIGLPGATGEELKHMQDTRAWAHDPWTGARGDSWNDGKKLRTGLGSYDNPAEIYTSPVLHSVTMTQLQPGTTYGYRVAGDSRNFSFTTPPEPGAAAFPLTIGLTADLGQTTVSAANVRALRELLANAQPHAGVVLLAGDLSYADGYYSRWDTFGRMLEHLASEIPVMTTGGNHEIGDSESWVSYNARYPMPHESSGSVTNLWWAVDVGPAHVVSLCSYAETRSGSLQYRWLERHLSTIDRSVTPWLIVMMHVPWYNSNTGHIAEAELMRQHMEPLFYRFGVDLVLSGHVHAYERMYATYRGERNPCGPVYLNLGDGGNREGAYIPWVHPQPLYSAFREGSFGTGSLRLINATHAFYNWSRSACEAPTGDEHVTFSSSCVSSSSKYGVTDNAEHPLVASDAVWIVRPLVRVGSLTCPPADTPGAPRVGVPKVMVVHGEEASLAIRSQSLHQSSIIFASMWSLLVAMLCGVLLGGVMVLVFQQMARRSRVNAIGEDFKVAGLNNNVGMSQLDVTQRTIHLEQGIVGRADSTDITGTGRNSIANVGAIQL